MKYFYLTFLLLISYTAYAQVWGLNDTRTEYRDDAGLSGANGAKSGFFQTVNPSNYPGAASGWWHLLDVRHDNPANNYAMQITGSFFDQNLYYRKTNNNASQTWNRFLAEDSNGNLTTGKITIATVDGQSFFTGHQLGGTYAYPDGIFRAITDNSSANNIFFDGLSGTERTFSVRSSGIGYFARGIGIGTTSPQSAFDITQGVTPYNATTMQNWNWLDDVNGWGLRLDMYHSGNSIDYHFMQRSASGDHNVLTFKNGNSGISTSNPQNTLHVDGGITSTNGSVISSSTPSINLFYDAPNDKGVLSSIQPNVAWKPLLFGALNFSFMSYGTNQGLFQDALGHVGIGTITPGDALTVQDRIRVSTSNGQGGYYASDASTAGNSIFSLTRQGNDLALSAFDGIGFTSAARSGPTNAYQMFINTDGKVGIGMGSTPARAPLHINSSGSQLNSTQTYNGDLIIQGSTGGRTATAGASLEFVIPANSDGQNPWGQGRIITVPGNGASGDATGKMILGTRRFFEKVTGTGFAWNYGDDLMIDGAGNIGMGTLNTNNYKLAVNGSVHTKAVVVDLTGFPDYVFKPTYKLKPLKEVEAYINQNHHLPEMPSEKEVAANGLNIGEINTLLTKKVEELTLYIIEKDKQVNELKQQKLSQDQRIDKLEIQIKALLGNKN